MSQTNFLQQIANQINSITQSLDGTIASIEAMQRKLEDNSKSLLEGLTSVNENMRLIIQVVKKSRSNTKEVLSDVKNDIQTEIEKLWNEKSLEAIGKDELEAIQKLKNINSAVGENLYMAQLLGVIQSLRQVIGQAKLIKLSRNKSKI